MNQGNGPISGPLVALVIVVLQAFTVSAGRSWIGAVMHFAATGSMVWVAGTIYKRYLTYRGVLVGLCLGSLTMTALMIPLNLPREAAKVVNIAGI